MKVTKTDLGFRRIEFTDRRGEDVILNENSTLGEATLSAEIHTGLGHYRSCMCLRREQVEELIPLLRHFADTGFLPEPEGE